MKVLPTIRLEQTGRLSGHEREAILAACRVEATYQAGENLTVEGARPDSSMVMLEGWACRYKIVGDRRQIMSFHIPGDWIDLQSYFVRTMDHSVAAVTDCRVAQVPHAAIQRLTEGYPRLAKLLWRETAIDSAVFREWVANIGARDAVERLAHLLCEIRTRLNSVGLVNGDKTQLPLSQVDIADSIGVSTVHANRVISELRRRGLIQSGRGSVTISDWMGLVKAGGFDPAYLHLEEGPPVARPTA